MRMSYLHERTVGLGLLLLLTPLHPAAAQLRQTADQRSMAGIPVDRAEG
jgi:hypothetical protein